MSEILSLDKVKEKLGLPAAVDPVNDPKLTLALPVITEHFENYCKRGLAYVDGVIEEHSPSTRIGLFRFPIDEITAFMIDGAAATVPHVDYTHGFLRLGYDSHCQTVLVTYSGGYPEDEVPADLADAYAKCVADYAGVPYTTGGGSSGGGGAPLKSLGLGSGALTVSFETATSSTTAYDTSSVPALLAPYHYVLEHYRLKDYV